MAIDEKRRQKKLAKKAAERKIKQAERTALSTGGSSAVAARFPIGDCLIPISLFREGIGHVVLTRLLPNGKIALAGFLVDTFCLGVKNAMYREISGEEFEFYRQEIESRTSLESAHPSCLRKLVESAVRYAQDIGFSPHPDYAKAYRLFGDIDAAVCPVRYKFGKDGQPFYINGPYETPSQQRKIIDTLMRNLGPDGFHYALMTGDLEEEHAKEPSSARFITYKVSDEPPEDSAWAKLPESVQEEVGQFHKSVLAQPRESIPHLLELIEQYPDLPQNYNYLHIAYKLLHDQENADRVLQETLERFPDYLFGRIAQANDCFERGEIDRIPEIFEGKFDLSLLYPDRKHFHISEMLNFSLVIARYFYAKGEKDQAERCYQVMKKLDPDHKTTRMIEQILHPKPKKTGAWLRNLLPKG
jgi:tetratricopeptide (TPR) repeat protein